MTTSLATIAQVLDRGMAIDARLADWEIRGLRVNDYRRYYDGDHDANMTLEMRKLLRIKSRQSANQPGSEFADNYMQIVVDTMADRVNLDTITADNDAATTWLQEVVEYNDVDALQADIHSAAIRDGETYVMPAWDEVEQRVKWTHELAYDGTSGMLVLYRSNDMPIIEAAIKIWVLTAQGGKVVDTVRVNVYLPDKIIKVIAADGGTFQPFIEDDREQPEKPGVYPWLDRNKQPLGIPVVPFLNRPRQNQGLSEISNAIPLQNVLNRVLHSIVMTSELGAFPIKWVVGAPVPKDITPGMFITFAEDGLTPDQAAAIKMGQWDAADMNQQLATAQWVTGEIGKVTRTPAPEFADGDNASGEALKQREIGLLGKINRFQVIAGSAWASVAKLSWNIQAAFGSQPPAWTRFYASWKDAEIRNDAVTIKNALLIKDSIGERKFLELIANIYEWDSEEIDRIIELKQAETGNRLATLVGNLPSFNNFNAPTPGGNGNGNLPMMTTAPGALAGNGAKQGMNMMEMSRV